MSKAGKRVKSGAGQGGPAKWEAALLAAQFEEVNPKILLFDVTLHIEFLPLGSLVVVLGDNTSIVQNTRIKLYTSIVQYRIPELSIQNQIVFKLLLISGKILENKV